MSDMMTQEEAMNMSNEQAVQILIPMRNMMCDQNGCPISDAVFALDKAIEALSADRPQGWIPCSERLPEDNERVLVTTAWGYVTIGWIKQNIWSTDLIVNLRDFVLAWMPCPEPWKGADDGADNI